MMPRHHKGFEQGYVPSGKEVIAVEVLTFSIAALALALHLS